MFFLLLLLKLMCISEGWKLCKSQHKTSPQVHEGKKQIPLFFSFVHSNIDKAHALSTTALVAGDISTNMGKNVSAL